MVSPLFYGAHCNGRDDDAPAINKAVSEIRRQRATGDLETMRGVLRLPALQCTIKTAVNLTGLRSASVLIDGAGGLLICRVSGKVCVDAMDSSRLTIRDLSLYGAQSDLPRIGLQLGRPSHYGGAPGMYLDHVTISGFFSLTAFYNLNAETQVDLKLNASNDAPNGYGAIYDGLNHFAAESDFMAVTSPLDREQSFNDNSCVNCRITTNGAGGIPLWIGDTSELTFANCYVSNFKVGPGAILYGTNTNLNFDAHFEATGLTHVFVLSGESHPVLYGLRFREHDTFATQSIFALSPTVQSAKLENVEVDIGRFYGTTKALWFDDPQKYEVSGRVTAMSSQGWNPANSGFSGITCFGISCQAR